MGFKYIIYSYPRQCVCYVRGMRPFITSAVEIAIPAKPVRFCPKAVLMNTMGSVGATPVAVQRVQEHR